MKLTPIAPFLYLLHFYMDYMTTRLTHFDVFFYHQGMDAFTATSAMVPGTSTSCSQMTMQVLCTPRSVALRI